MHRNWLLLMQNCLRELSTAMNAVTYSLHRVHSHEMHVICTYTHKQAWSFSYFKQSVLYENPENVKPRFYPPECLRINIIIIIIIFQINRGRNKQHGA